MAKIWRANRRDFHQVLHVVLPLPPLGKQNGVPWRDSRGRQRVSTAKTTRAWMTAAALLLKRAMGSKDKIQTPVQVTLIAVKARPSSFPKYANDRLWCPVKPDVDNITKATFDAVTKAGVWTDDARVVSETVETFYAAPGEEPHVEIIIRALAPATPREDFKS